MVAEVGAPATGAQPPSERGAVWSRYWAQGALHSCATSYAGNYGGALAGFWRDVFDALPAGARVLDIATGNGALPQLLLQCRAQDPLRIDAVDLAAVDPPWVHALPAAQRERLHLHPGVAAEHLPFDDATFDLVVSQYGFEYADAGRAAAELRRVLRPGGRVAMVLHHAASRPVTLAADEIAHIDWLCRPDGLLAVGGRLLGPMARAATEAGRRALVADRDALADRERFNALQRELSQRLPAATCPDVLHEAREALARLFESAARHGEAAATAQWHALATHLADSRLRLVELRACALDEAALRLLAARIRPGATAVFEPLREGDWLMGWSMRIGLA